MTKSKDIDEFMVCEWCEDKAIVAKKECHTESICFSMLYDDTIEENRKDYGKLSVYTSEDVGEVFLVYLSRAEALRFAKRLIACIEAY